MDTDGLIKELMKSKRCVMFKKQDTWNATEDTTCMSVALKMFLHFSLHNVCLCVCGGTVEQVC